MPTPSVDIGEATARGRIDPSEDSLSIDTTNAMRAAFAQGSSAALVLLRRVSGLADGERAEARAQTLKDAL